MLKPQDKHSERRQLLWNVLQPGDPYDIKKSLIAKMPGDKKLFMGDNVQMVCLFQAAEIERLIQYLDQYRLKYKELERKQLDRHYYEVQIKQLTELCSDSELLRVQVGKLKEHIRRLNDQIVENRGREEDLNLRKKYEDSLQQIGVIHKENSDLKTKIMSMSSSIETWKTRCQALEKSKIRQIEQMRNRVEMQRRTLIDRQQREQELIKRFQIQRNQLEIEIRRLREETNAKTIQLQQSRQRLSQFNRQSNFGTAQLEAKYFDMQNKARKYIQEIDNLNLNLRQLIAQRNQFSSRFSHLENQIVHRDNQIREYHKIISTNEGNIAQLNQRIIELQAISNDFSQFQRIKEQYENKLVMSSQEITRLNNFSQLKVSQAQQAVSRYSRLQYQVQILKNENNNLVFRLSQKDSATRTIHELQENILRLTSENRRLSDGTSTIRQSGGFQNLQIQNMQLKKRLQDLQTEALNTVQQLRNNNGLEIQRFTEREQNHRQRISQLEIAFNTLQATRGGNSRSNNQVSQYRQRLNTLSTENAQIKKNYEQQIIYLNQENNNMKRQLDNLRRRASNQATGSSEQFIRLENQIRQWENKGREWILEKEQLVRITEDHQRRSRVSSDLQTKFREYEIKIKSLTQQLVGRQKDISKEAQQYEDSISKYSEEIRRLQDKLKAKNQEIVNLQIRRGQNPQTERQLQEYISKYQKSEQEILILRQQLQGTNQNDQVMDLWNQNNKLNAQKQALQQKIFNLTEQLHQIRESSGSNSMLQELQISLKNLEAQNQQLKSRIRTFQEQNNRYVTDMRAYQSSIKELKADNDHLKLTIIELQNQASVDVENIPQSEAYSRQIISALQQRVRTLTIQRQSILSNNLNSVPPRQLQDARKQISILSRELERTRENAFSSQNQINLHQKILVLNNEVQKLNARIRTKNEQAVSLDTKYKKILSERTQITNINNTYVQKIEELSRQIKRLEGTGLQQNEMFRQIQRLNLVLRTQVDENSNLLQKLRQLQQGNINSGQLSNEYQRTKIRYQEVVSRLTTYEQRIQISSRQMQGLRLQNNNLNATIQRLINQINEYKKFQYTQTTQTEKIVFVRNENERLVVTINELNIKIRQMIEENQMLKRRLNQTTQRVQIQIKNHIAMYEQRIANAEQRYAVEQQRFSAAVQEVDQLRRKTNEISIFERRVAETEIRINNLTLENRKIPEYQQRIVTLTHQLDQVRRQDQTQKFVAELNEYSKKYPILQNENQFLQRQVQELSQKLQFQMNNRINIENQFRALNDQSQNQKHKIVGEQKRVHQYQSHISMFKQQITKLTTDIERSRRTQIELTNHLNEANRRIADLTNEIERVNIIVRQGKNNMDVNMQNLIQQIQRLNNSLRVKVTESTQWQNKFLFLQNQSMVIRQDYETLRSTLIQNGSETDAYRKRIEEHQTKFRRLNGEFQKLSQIINQLKRQNTALKQQNANLQALRGSDEKNRVLSVEIQRLTALVQSLEQQIAELRVRFVDQNALQQRIKEHLSLFVVLFAEIQSLRKRVKDKEKEVQQVRRSSLVPFMS